MNAKEFLFDCHDEVRDKVTGFSGVILAMSYYATGCRHYGVVPKKMDKDGKAPDWTWFDESRLVMVAKKKVKEPEIKRGGPSRNPVMIK